MVDRRQQIPNSGFKDGQPPRSSRGYDLLAIIISAPTTLNRDEITGTNTINLITPEYKTDEACFIAATRRCDRTSPSLRHNGSTRIAAQNEQF
jgi:hypothetical protein